MSHILYIMSMQPILESDSLPPHKKIGITSNIGLRANQLQTKMPFTMYVEAAWEIPNGRPQELESALHTVLDALNIDGEWFQDPDDTLVDGVGRLLRFTEAKPINETKLDDADTSRTDLENRYKQTAAKVLTLLGDVDPARCGWTAQPARAVDQRFTREGSTVYVRPNTSGATLTTAGRDSAVTGALRSLFGTRVQRSEYSNGQSSEWASATIEELRRFFSEPLPVVNPMQERSLVHPQQAA